MRTLGPPDIGGFTISWGTMQKCCNTSKVSGVKKNYILTLLLVLDIFNMMIGRGEKGPINHI